LQEFILEGVNRAFTRNAYFASDFKGNVPVRCVQQHRWSPISSGLPGVLKDAPTFEFGGMVPRDTVRAIDQRGTWGSVDEYLTGTQVRSSTWDLGEIYNKRKSDFDEFKKKFLLVEGQVGAVAVVNKGGRKKFISDVFDKSSSFQEYFDHLLSVYILESGLDTEKRAELSEIEARGFLDSVDVCTFREIKPISLGQDFEMSAEKLFGSSLCYSGNLVYASLDTPTEKDTEREKERVYFETPIIRGSFVGRFFRNRAVRSESEKKGVEVPQG
jgi:hypothetical protein